MTTPHSPASTQPDRVLIGAAWAAMLCVSDLPNMLLGLRASEPAWLSLTKTAFLALCLVLTLTVPRLRALWKYALVFAVFYLAKSASVWVVACGAWQGWFRAGRDSFFIAGLSSLLPDLGLMAIMVALTWAVMRGRQAAFVARGEMSAAIEPVRWLGIGRGESWKKFGWIFSACIALAVGAFVVLSAGPALGMAARLLPLVPAAVFLAVLNALEEELSYRAPLLATTHAALGRGPSLWLTAVFFGLAHTLYGTPAGIVGFLYTGFVAYLFGKSMLETRGSGWAIVMHTIADIPIFLLYALNSL